MFTPDQNHYLPDRLSFDLYGLEGQSFMFRCRDGALWSAWDPEQPSYALPPSRRVEPAYSEWSAFWFDMRNIGVWYWRSEYQPKDFVILDGVQWDLELSIAGHHVKVYGNNAYPPDSRLEPSEAFRQVLRVFGQVCGDELFVRKWYHR